MRLRFTFLAIACLSLLLILFAYLFSVQTSLEKITDTSNEKLAVSELSVRAALASVSEQQLSFVKDYGFWDDMALAVQKEDIKWISQEFYGPMEIYGSDGIWVVSQGQLLYEEYSPNSRVNPEILLPPIQWNELGTGLVATEPTQFFSLSPQQEIIAYYISPILYHTRQEMNQTPYGYIVVAKIWDAEVQTKLSNLLQATITIEPTISADHVNNDTVAQHFDQAVVDSKGQPAAYLHFAFHDQSVAVLASYLQVMMRNTALFGLIAITFCLVVFQVTLIWPIQKLITKLRRSPILNQTSSYQGRGSELAILAQQIDDFIRQSQKLQDKNQELKETDEKLERVVAELQAAEKATSQELRTSLKLAKAVASATEAMVITDTEGHIEYVNPAWESLNGYSQAEALGKKPSLLKSGRTNTILYKQLWESITSGQAFSSEEVINKRKDGSLYAAHVSIYPVESDHKTINFVGIVIDVSARKERERLKSEFISLASHQLRTPLTSLRWLSELLQKQAKKSLTKTQQGMLGDIEKSSIRMIALVNRLLNLSRIETGRLSITPQKVNLPTLLKSIEAELKPLAKNKGIKLSFSVPKSSPHFHADEDLLQEIVLNLITNSLKYTPKGGEVNVTVADKTKWIFFEVKDTGIGIPEAEQVHIFTRFFRASNALEHDEQGTGLGLYLAKLLVESLGGKIKLVSKEGEGTTVSFILPQTGAKRNGEISLLHSKVEAHTSI